MGQEYETPNVTHADPAQNQCVAPADQSSDFGSNQDLAESARTEGEVREAARDLGQVNDLGGGFTRAAGNVLDALIPNVGDKGKATLTANIPVDQSGTVKVQFRFAADAERDENGVKGRIQVGGGVVASREDDFYFFTTRVFAAARVFGYVEAYGDSSAEMFSLMSLGLQQRVASVSTDIASAVWDQATIDATIAGMNGDGDDDDYVETGMGVELEVGASIGGRDQHGSFDPVAGVGAGGGFQAGTRLSGDGRGGLESEGTGKFDVFASFAADPFAGQVKFTRKSTNDTLSAVEVEVEGNAEMDADELGAFILQDHISGTVQTAASVITGNAGLLQDESAARQAGSIGQMIANTSTLGSLARAGTDRALEELRGVGVSFGHKLTIKGAWEPNNGISGEVCLERVSNFEVGTGEHSAGVHLAIENLQRVFRIPLGA